MDSDLPRSDSWSKMSFIGATPYTDENSNNSSIASIGSVGSVGSVGSTGSNGSVGRNSRNNDAKNNNIVLSSSTEGTGFRNIASNSNGPQDPPHLANSKHRGQLVRTSSSDVEIASSCQV